MEDDKFMYLLPILCFDCGRPLANKQKAINKLLYEDGVSFVDAMTRLGIESYCCRGYVLSPLTVPFGSATKPIGSIGEFEVPPEVTQIWTGTSNLVRAPQEVSDVVQQPLLNVDTIEDSNLLPSISEQQSLFIPPSEFQESLLQEALTIEPSRQPSMFQPSFISSGQSLEPSFISPSQSLQPSFISPNQSLEPSFMQSPLSQPSMFQPSLMQSPLSQPSMFQPSLMQSPLSQPSMLQPSYISTSSSQLYPQTSYMQQSSPQANYSSSFIPSMSF